MNLGADITGDKLLDILAALGNSQRLRIVAALAPGRNYVSNLARQLRMSRPLLYMHLRKLEAAGLVSGSLELSEEGRATKYFEIRSFALEITPELIAEAAQTLTVERPAAITAVHRENMNLRREHDELA